MNGLEYTELYASESFGNYGGFGIKILVASTNLPDLSSSVINSTAHKAADIVSAEIMSAIVAGDEDAKRRSKKQKVELLAVFPDRIFVEEIPNCYCSDWCCRHLPWFIITTETGRFKIGWRKRVIHLEWTDTVGTKSAEELFSEEETTKSGKMIHAWTLDKASEYVKAIIANAEALED